MLDFGSVPEDTEATFPQGSSMKETLFSFLVLKITTEMFRWTRKTNTMAVGRANSGKPVRGPKLEKTNLVLETGLRIRKAQGAVAMLEHICSTCSALDLPSPESSLSPIGHEMSLCVARAAKPDSAA